MNVLGQMTATRMQIAQTALDHTAVPAKLGTMVTAKLVQVEGIIYSI